MFVVTVASGIVAVVAVAVYLGRERLGLGGVGMALLRTVAMGALLLLIINPTTAERVAGGSPVVLLDASLSMGVESGRWIRALDSARALAGPDGLLLRFGAAVAPFDTFPPVDGRSMLREPLRTAFATSGRVLVVTDGEIEDASAIDPGLLDRATVVVMSRDTVFDAALLEARVPQQVQRDDSIPISLTIGQWGDSLSGVGNVRAYAGDRALATWNLDLPSGTGVARRSVAIRSGALTPGTHVVRFLLTVSGDRIPGDDERYAVVRVSEQPAIVVMVDPPGWEGRFMVSELLELARAPVSGYAHVRDDSWLDMRTLDSLPASEVQRNALRAGALLAVGPDAARALHEPGKPIWLWPIAGDSSVGAAGGDWYPDGDVPPSPLGGQLGRVRWDSLPPLSRIFLSSERGEWVGLTARRARRGPPQALLLGADSGGVRRLTTAGAGLWRWRFRGGVSREAYRTLLAAGMDWLLRSDAPDRRAPLSASDVVARGEPILFRWRGDSVPDSISLRLETVGGADTAHAVLRFDQHGNAARELAPGIYRWRVDGAPNLEGLSVVEPYSDEFHPRPVIRAADAAGGGTTLVERAARQRWWLFAIIVIALTGEWAWRQRRGLP